MTTRQTRPPRWTEYVPLDEVLRAPRNPKNHAASVLESSIGRFGYVESVTLDERTGRLVAGHGRLDQLQASRDAGDDPPDGVTVDGDGNWMIPVSRGWSSRSDQDAEAYLIMSNQATMIGGWDEPELHRILAELRDADLLEFTGFTGDDLDDMRKLHEPPDLDELADDIGDPLEDDGWPVIRVKVPPHVAAAWRTKVEEHSGMEPDAFAALLGVDPLRPPAVDWTP